MMGFPCHNCFYAVEPSNDRGEPCASCNNGGSKVDIYDYAKRLRAALAASQLESGTQGLRADRLAMWVEGLSDGLQTQAEEIAHLRSALAGDKAPPLKFSVGRCREIEGEVSDE